MNSQLTPQEFEGKTYSLRTAAQYSDSYYRTISRLADTLLQSDCDADHLLDRIRSLSKSKRVLQRLERNGDSSEDARLLRTLRTELATFTPGAERHLQSLRGFDRWNRTLATSLGQYHLSMLEIELTNRLQGERFRECDRKYAFLPHCLRDLLADCRATQRDVDYVCKGCSESCHVNHASKILRLHGVKPYIWMTANLRTLFRKVKNEGSSLGVLGIACIPELIRGMRLCMKHGVPVVGIPLDANRCARWWGEFHPNTVDLEKLESLLKT